MQTQDKEKQSQLDQLIKDNSSLKQIFDDPGFMDEVYNQKEELFEYLGKDENIQKMFDFMYDPNQNQQEYKNTCNYAFYSYTTISNCESQLTKKIIKSKEYMKRLFSFINENKDESMTSWGYFQQIIKNFISELNPHFLLFIRAIKLQPDQYIFPLIKNLSRANSEIIKEILGNQEKKLEKIQICVFEYLLFFYLNEQFEETDFNILTEYFDNLISIFNFLTQENLKFNYKLKYEYTLYSEEYVNNKKYLELIYYLKLVLLNYISFTKQIITCPDPEIFIMTYKKYQKSKKFIFYLKSILTFFANLSTNVKFQNVVKLKFIEELVNIVENISRNDIIHSVVFQIFDNLRFIISKNEDMIKLIYDFILRVKNLCKIPCETKKQLNQISLHFIFKLITALDFQNLSEKEKEEMQNYKDLLSTIFTKLCYTENEDEENSFSVVQEHSDVQLALKSDFASFLKNKNMLDDKRFHYEDNIMEVEPIETSLLRSNSDRNSLRSKDINISQVNDNNPIMDSNIIFEQKKSNLLNGTIDQNELFSPNSSNIEDQNENIEQNVNNTLLSKSNFQNSNLENSHQNEFIKSF